MHLFSSCNSDKPFDFLATGDEIKTIIHCCNMQTVAQKSKKGIILLFNFNTITNTAYHGKAVKSIARLLPGNRF